MASIRDGRRRPTNSPSRRSEELRGLIATGDRAGLSDVRGDRLDARGGGGHEGAGLRAAQPPRRAGRGRDRGRRGHRVQGEQGREDGSNGTAEAGAGSDRRAEPGFAAALSALDRLGRPADGRAGGGAGEEDRAGGHGCEAAHGGGQPAAGRVDREVLSGAGAELPGPDSGGVAGTDPGGGEVRLPAGIQVLDLRHLVDQAGGDQGAGGQVEDDPDPGSHGGEAEPGGARREEPGSEAGTGAGAAGDRGGAGLDGAGGAGGAAGQPDAGFAGEAGGG